MTPLDSIAPMVPMRRDRSSILVLILGAVALISWLGSRGLNEPDEGRYAEVGREMALQTNWLIPHLNGVEHFQKPPLIYWLTAACIRLLGVNEWAVRLPPALAAWGTLGCTMFIAGRLFGSTTRWTSGLILLSSIEFFAMGRTLSTDMLLTFFITLSIAGLVARHTGTRTATGLVVFYLAAGLGFLTKGPIALLAPTAAALGLRCGLRRTAQSGPIMAWIPGMLIALTSGLSWYAILGHEFPPLLDYFLGYELRDRLLTNVHDRSKPFWFYSAILVAGFMPWTFFIPGIVRGAWKRRATVSRPLIGLLTGWVLIPLLFFSVATSKLATYMLPLFPALSVVLAHEWDRILGQRAWLLAIRWTTWFFALLLLLLPVAAWMARDRYGLTVHIPPAVILCGIVCVILFLSIRHFSNTVNNWPWILPGISGTMLLMLLMLVSQADQFFVADSMPMKRVAAFIQQNEKGMPAPVFMCGLRSNGMEFYLQRLVQRTQTASDVVLVLNPDAQARIIDEDKAADHVRSLAKIPSYIFLKERRFLKDPIFKDWQVCGHFGKCVLLSPPPPVTL